MTEKHQVEINLAVRREDNPPDDFTWDGLRGKPAPNHDSLQDYWLQSGAGKTTRELIQMGEVIKADGHPTYHLIHLPLSYPDGSPTFKTARPEEAKAKLDEILVRVLSHSSNKLDAPARLHGAVFLEFGLSSTDIRFAINADFSHARFTEAADFTDARFSGQANFWHARFDKNAVFWGTNFEKEARFWEAEFHGVANFWQAVFWNEGRFWEARFHQEANFELANFEDAASFVRTRFSREMIFASTRFKKHAIFKEITWPDDPNHHLRAFDQAIFSDTADFSGAGCKAFGAFDGARFKEGLKFDEVSEPEAKLNFKRELWRSRFDERTGRLLLPYLRFVVLRLTGRPGAFDRPDDELRSIENGCRVLKQEMARVSDKTREQLFYQFELMAQREQRSISFIEYIVSIFYEYVSDYGSSIIRPKAFLFLALLPLFALVYWILSGAFFLDLGTIAQAPFLATSWDNALRSLAVSASRIFPFGAFEGVSSDFADEINGQGRPVSALIYMFVATLQSFLALVLAFLIGLAIRRRFQIN